MRLSDYTLALLDDIERRIDPETEEDYRAQWRQYWFGEVGDTVARPRRKKTTAPSVEVKPIHINDAQKELEWMLDAELASLSGRLSNAAASLGMRANYGTGIMTTLFGAELFEMPRETNTLPTTRSFNDSDKIREMLDRGMPDLYGGLGGKVLLFGEQCAELFERYPNIKTYVDVFHPDTQGPLDIAELLWGGEMFYEMYDDPELVHAAMRLITDTYLAFMDKWYSIMPKKGELAAHWGIMHPGGALLRMDSGMNLSREFYEQYSKPYDREVFDHFGGGCLHFCGRGDHYVSSLCDIDNLYGINMSEPENNDMERIFGALSAVNKRVFGFPRPSQYAPLLGNKQGLMQA